MNKKTFTSPSIMITELPGEQMAAAIQGTETQIVELLCAAAKNTELMENSLIIAALVTVRRKGKDLTQIAKILMPMVDGIISEMNKKKGGTNG